MTYKYNKRGIEPKNIESPFALDELFFSITDPKGIILTGNDVFQEVSKFDRDELIGKPHNIIRHPDMPRAIFKAVWDTIKAGKPFVGYVKNMAKDGSYYWVLAVIYPVVNEEGKIEKYISIRLKPSSKIFDLIPNLYKEILEVELKNDMESALSFMREKLHKLGFETYENFSKKAFFEEIQSREKLLDNQNNVSCQTDLTQVKEKNIEFIDLLCNLQTIFFRLNRYFNEIFGKVNLFLNLNEELNQKSKFIYELAEDIRLLSLNASIESYKIKKDGVSFSTLSHEMRKNAELSERKILQLSKIIENTKKDIEDIGFNILSSKLIIEMITFFIKEMIQNLSQASLSHEKQQEVINNINELFELLRIYAKHLAINVDKSKSQLRSMYYNIQELNVLINRLDFIHINGLIESAHTKEEGGGFTIIFSQMLKLIEAAKSEIINLETSISSASEENQNVNLITQIAQRKIMKLQKEYGTVLNSYI
ncbi:aerotaxis receptor [Nitratiruptor sp. YY08-26]|uniref:methyl-accepting chemotaxis protein n=1 Tax=unclassified Nitratiruptor TaxID=2624044 RepID=UPI0019157DAA|nr:MULTISPECIES: PAS domain-containing methyl-accepting chemotaxis protein [unclassified Nitratiruptor]BCD61838.1 aerotaxis receptor [Nitratiruptor sp. YY08-13]BCD65773.1 aerotaxis receptor [Nitratiruptor sp. YY08-26]